MIVLDVGSMAYPRSPNSSKRDTSAGDEWVPGFRRGSVSPFS